MPKVETFNRDHILEKVIQLFHKKGYNATSMQDLVDVTGLNRSSIYNSFGSKMELYQESLKQYKNNANKHIQKILIHNTNALEAIQKVFTFDECSMQNGCLLSNCTTEMANKDQTIKNFLKQNKESLQDLFEALIQKGQEKGTINTKQSASAYSLYLFSSLQGFRVSSILTENKTDLKSIIGTTLSVLK